MHRIMIFTTLFAFSGCGGLPRIQFGKTQVLAPKDAGTPAQLASNEEKTSIGLPAKSQVVLVEVDAVAATEKTPARPAQKLTFFDFSQPSQFEHIANKLAASTGTIDTFVASKRIDVESKKPLLYASIVCAGAGVACMVMKWPSIAALCGVASGAFFAAWKVADVPPWVGLLFLVAGIAGFAFYKRAEWDKNGDGIPDRLQKPQEP